MQGSRSENGEESFALSERLPPVAADEPYQRTVSSGRSHRSRICLPTVARVLAWLALLAVMAATLSPAEGRPHLLPDVTAERSGAHFLLGVLFCVAYRTRWPAVLVLVLTATAGLEAAQLLVGGRYADFADAFVKMSGVVAGFTIGLLFRSRITCG